MSRRPALPSRPTSCIYYLSEGWDITGALDPAHLDFARGLPVLCMSRPSPLPSPLPRGAFAPLGCQ